MDRLRSIFDGMFDGVWLVAADGRTTYANGAMAGLLGQTRAQMRGRPMADFVDEALRPEVAGFLARQRTLAGERIELRLRRADGTDLFGLVAGNPIFHGGRYVGTMLNVSDVTGKRSIDAQLTQNQRLEAIGTFAGGIAHDFNNLLAAIQGYAELARDGLPEGDPIRSDIDQVIASADRAGAITRKLLAFTSRQILMPVDLDPAQVIADLVPMFGPLMGDDVDVRLNLDTLHAWVRADPTQLEQIIVNLTVNARDAMPFGGTVTISVNNVEPTDPDLPDDDLTAGPFVRISVADTGTGMDDATRERIFDPFFTTKGPTKGTGLGLSTVFGIVAQSGGQIHVETALGAGSTFHVDLPRVGALIASRKLASADDVAASGVVLLVDDDPPVREFARRSLERAGYTVLAAAGGDQAIRASARWEHGIDVLLTDFMMPGIHGPELAARIRAERPAIGVVMMSGAATDDLGRDTPAGRTEFLAKPFTGAALSRAVARAASEARRPPAA